jgi:hypothetical protein
VISPTFIQIPKRGKNTCFGLAWGKRGWYQWEGERGRKMVKDSEYGTNTMYTSM